MAASAHNLRILTIIGALCRVGFPIAPTTLQSYDSHPIETIFKFSTWHKDTGPKMHKFIAHSQQRKLEMKEKKAEEEVEKDVELELA